NKRKQFTSSNPNDTIPQIPRRNVNSSSKTSSTKIVPKLVLQKDTKAPKTFDTSEKSAHDSSTSSPITSNSSIYDTPTIKFTSKNLSDIDGSSNDQSKQTFPSKKGLSNINSQTDNIPNYLKTRKQHHLKRMESAPVIHAPNVSTNDENEKTALKAYMESFDFEKDPIDIALRKLLMECHLPKETQQIDRVMEAFAKRYHELNPDLFASSDTPYVLAFSLLMLHTDAFNKNVKRKMTKEDFIKNTRIDGVNPEILETMLESPTSDHRQLKIFSSSKDKRKSIRPKNDPYHVIQTKQGTEFKPYLKDIIPVENPYSYIGTLPSLDIVNLHRAFSSAQTIRITGVQNRRNGDSFSSTTSSFQPSKDGTFLLKITKGGKLGRKVDLIDGKKKGGRNWKLYGNSTKLPVLKPDAILMTADSVAVFDKSYDKYKNVFRLVCPQGHQYLFQAENESEMNDWISKINYAATFKTIGLKIRNVRSGTAGGMSSFGASLHNIPDVNENDSDIGTGVGNENVPTDKKREEKDVSKKQSERISRFGNSGINRREIRKGGDKFRPLFRLKEDNAKDAQGRANLLRTKIEELQGKISTLTAQLQNEVRFRNNLFLMIPYRASTRDRIVQIAITVATKLRHTCLELSRLLCYHEILEKDLCATVMEDDRYWLNRRSMYRLCGESSSEDNNNISLIGSITGGDGVSAMMSMMNTENKEPSKKLLDIDDIKDIADMTNITKSFGFEEDSTTTAIKSSKSPSRIIKTEHINNNKVEVKDKGKNEKIQTVPISILPKSSTSSLSSMPYSSNGGDSYGGGSSQTTVSQHDEEEYVYRHGNASEFDLGFERDNNLDDSKDDGISIYENDVAVKFDVKEVNDSDLAKDRSDIIDLQTIDPQIIEALYITDNSPSIIFNNPIREDVSLPVVETNIQKSNITIMTPIIIDDDDEEIVEEEEEIFVDSYEFSDGDSDEEFVDAEEYIDNK
ncbi:12773_t:CDS:10, partial [Cetraspora pellucida]